MISQRKIFSDSLHRKQAAKSKASRKIASKTYFPLILLTGLLLPIGMIVTLATGVSARFTPPHAEYVVEIGGQSFGSFDQVQGLEVFENHPNELGHLTLTRDFVTDPSLYLWAKRSSDTPSLSSEMLIILNAADGQELTRYRFQLKKALSWEAAGLSAGGFYESVKVAVMNSDLPISKSEK